MPPHNPPHLIIDNTHRVVAPVDYDRRPQHETEEERLYTGGVRAMPSARAATASQPSLLRVSGIAGIAIAAFAALYFGAQLVRGAL